MTEFKVMTKAYVEATVKSCMTKWTSTLKLQILEDFESTSEDTLLPGYFTFDEGLKTAMFKVIEPPLLEFVRSIPARAEVEDRVRNFVLNEDVPETIIHSVLHSTDSLSPSRK